MRILLIEDDKQIAEITREFLKEEGYAVDTAFCGEEGEKLIDSIPYDLIILDIVLSGKDGLELCRDMRRKGIKTPVLLMTGKKDTLEDRIAGLDTGADDYLLKPYRSEDLLSRVRALLRRGPAVITPVIQVGELAMDTVAREVRFKHRPVELTRTEYNILDYLMRHPDQVVTRSTLEQHIYDLTTAGSSNLVDVYIGRLRARLGEQGEDSLIRTVRGVGYRLEGPQVSH
jgi:DNA-binding response OmpR family regulator